MKFKSLFILIILLSACARVNLEHNEVKKTLQLKINQDIVFNIKGCLIYESRVNLSHINIYQYVYKTTNNEIFTYEDIYVSSGYKFNKSMKTIMHNVFKSYNYNLVYLKANVFFFILNSKIKNKKLYVLLENKNKKSLAIMYGLDKSSFRELINILQDKQNLDTINPSGNTKDTYKDKNMYIESEWNYNNIILDNLISKLGIGRKASK